ncbi:SufD family Fe-S cluster assembly protein [Ureaplasma canigenitalium]|uniref:SufD family Fe-S cluster assembly protein n=1 Tax=Ureaplasma canigenitalium TaxID=42092 RepID=UPI0004E1F0DD|nr:SufD family Fe-S cluster assembly protein [Ureaplasma canigenitalium]
MQLIAKNKNSFLYQIKNEQKILFSIEKNETQESYFLIHFDNENVDLEIDFQIKEGASALVQILILNFDDHKKSITTHLHLNGSDGKIINNVQVIGFNDSLTNIELNAYIPKKSHNNEAYQNIYANLFDRAKAVGKPNLIIDSNEVKAGHSLQVGAISREIIFYLLSRGLSKNEAVKLILYSYFREIFNHFDDEIENRYQPVIDQVFRRIG